MNRTAIAQARVSEAAWAGVWGRPKSQTALLGVFFGRKGVSTCLDHTLHVGVGPRTPSHEPTVPHRIDLYGVLKQAVEQQSARS